MIDFTPLMTNPKMLFFGAAAQFGIFFTFSLASFFGFDIRDAASIAIIGAADVAYIQNKDTGGGIELLYSNRCVINNDCVEDEVQKKIINDWIKSIEFINENESVD